MQFVVAQFLFALNSRGEPLIAYDEVECKIEVAMCLGTRQYHVSMLIDTVEVTHVDLQRERIIRTLCVLLYHFWKGAYSK